HSIEYSESDVTALMQKLDIDHDTAAVLTVAKRMRVFCTESSELRRFAKVLEIDVVDANEFVSRFTKASRNATDSGAQ
ncbi:MAG: hypothetical protein KJ747_02235, partial [Actinobacteria bacterium]|nr:hypothetical protein [Actinomycetota bacterium]